MKTQNKGFTLVEIAIVMVIISALLAGGVAGFKSFRDAARYSEAENYLENARTALLGFALANGYLPCPDTDTSGADFGWQNDAVHGSGNTCAASEGTLPWQALGLAPLSSWDSAPFYAINQQADSAACDTAATDAVCFFEDEGAPMFEFSTPPLASTAGTGTLTVVDSAGNTVATNLLAVVGMTGSNGRQTELDCAGQSADESENCDGDATFVLDRLRTNRADFFDDQLIWINANTIKGQMRDAGLL